MSQRFHPLFLVCIGAALVVPSVAPSVVWSTDLELVVMTFNIRYGTAEDGENHWDKRRELVVDLLRRHQPAVIGLQEALRFQIDQIRDALPEYAEHGVGRDDGATKGEYSAILYRWRDLELLDGRTWWLSDTPFEIASKTWGNNTTRICTWGRFRHKESGRTLTMYNVHLDHQSQTSRERSAEFLGALIQTRNNIDPVIVTGDFNAGEDNQAIRYLKGEITRASEGGPKIASPRLVDSFRVLHPEAREVGTFSGFRGRTGGAKIDYVFVSDWVTVAEAAILRDQKDGRTPSDHYPVTARLRIPGVRES